MSSCPVHQEEDLKGQPLLSEVQLHLRDKTVDEPVECEGFSYPCLLIAHPVDWQQCFIFVFQSPRILGLVN